MIKYVSESTCNARFNDLKTDLDDIKKIVVNIRENHIYHLNNDMQTVKVYFKIIGAAISIIVPIMVSILLKVYFG